MDEKDISIVAQKMIELYGDDAEVVATGRAETNAACGKIEESVEWEHIATLICELQKQKRRTG